MVYFLEEERDHYIKIGYSHNPHARLQSLQNGSPIKYSLLATIEGDRRLEKRLHRRFQAYRVQGEWFAPCPELLSYIDSLKNPLPRSHTEIIRDLSDALFDVMIWHYIEHKKTEKPKGPPFTVPSSQYRDLAEFTQVQTKHEAYDIIRQTIRDISGISPDMMR